MLNAIGSQYMYNPIGIEFGGHWWSHGKIFGDQSVFLEPDDRNIDVLMFWGSNSYVTHNIGTARFIIREFSEDPDKLLIDVDPRLSETARMADMHIHNRVGSDSLLLRGLIALILDKGWQDQKFLDRWVGDWDRAKGWYEGFDYRKAFEVARVPLAQMEQFARILTTRTCGAVYLKEHKDDILYWAHSYEYHTAVCVGADVIPELERLYQAQPGSITPRHLSAALRKLGFDEVYDADEFINQAALRLEESIEKRLDTAPVFATTSYAVKNFVEKQLPDSAGSVVFGESPLSLFGQVARAKAGEDASRLKTIFISAHGAGRL